MKKLYWRPGKVSKRIHLFIALTAALGMFTVETLKTRTKHPHFKEKRRAAVYMRDAMASIRDFRVRNLEPIDPEVDPTGSGMVGLLISPITSNTGSLEAKQTTINPNWAAVLVHLMKRAGVKRGDTIGVGFSGSFPALNIAVLAASQALGLHPVIISSVSASMWGANHPKLTWLHMEKLLRERHILPFRSEAVSLGGQGDRGLGLSKHGQALLRKAVEESNVPLIFSADPKENLELRIDRYREAASEQAYSLYVNVGGGTISVGTAVGKKLFRPGLTKRPSAQALEIESAMSHFARDGIPIIHMRQIVDLAQRYGLPVTPTRMPTIGDGRIFYSEEYNLSLVGVVLIVLVSMLVVFMRFDLGHRIFHSGARAQASRQPERMV